MVNGETSPECFESPPGVFIWCPTEPAWNEVESSGCVRRCVGPTPAQRIATIDDRPDGRPSGLRGAVPGRIQRKKPGCSSPVRRFVAGNVRRVHFLEHPDGARNPALITSMPLREVTSETDWRSFLAAHRVRRTQIDRAAGQGVRVGFSRQNDPVRSPGTYGSRLGPEISEGVVRHIYFEPLTHAGWLT
jgi:hypothetical protein